MSTETTNKKIKIDNGTTFGRTYTDKAVDERLQGLVSTATFTPVKEKADNSLQKPAGLTKTELVGVGTNGQENIEIGDNLTLANGKLSATGGGSGGDTFDIITSTDGATYTGTISGTKPVLLIMTNEAYLSISYSNGEAVFSSTGISNKYQFRATEGKIKIDPSNLQKKLFLHFITLTSSTSTFYFTLQYTSKDKLNTFDLIKIVIAGKSLLCTGHTDTETAEYISGEGGNIIVGVVNKSDNSTSGITIDSSFTITDLVKPVE